MIVALHGFLGLPSDWSHFEKDLGPIEKVNLWSVIGEAAKGVDAFSTFADSLDAKLKDADDPWLMGYSMGGRLAMQAAVAHPGRFAGLILISANLGLGSQQERNARLEADAGWAEKFRSEPWDRVMSEWNAQPVLKAPEKKLAPNAIELERKESDFDRESLALAMEKWSLGRQRDLREEVLSLEIPVLYLSGSLDVKFTQMVSRLELPPSQIHNEIEGAGHRVPWDQPEAFVQAIQEFREFFGA